MIRMRPFNRYENQQSIQVRGGQECPRSNIVRRINMAFKGKNRNQGTLLVGLRQTVLDLMRLVLSVVLNVVLSWLWSVGNYAGVNIRDWNHASIVL
jgi:hypothetical protein